MKGIRNLKPILHFVVIFLIFGFDIGCKKGIVEGLYSLVSISNDDNLFCYVNLKRNIPSIYVVNRNGEKIHEIECPKERMPGSPVFSPDGKKILFLGNLKDSENPQSSIFLMDLDGKNLVQTTKEKENILEACFSPDGKKIYFLSSNFFGHYSPIVSSRAHDVDVYSIDFDGSNRKKLTDLKAYGLSDLCVSGDGKNLFFIEIGEVNELVSLPLDKTSSPTTLVSDIWDSSVSPDGKTIVYTKAKNELGGFKYDLYSKNRETSKIKQLTDLKTMVFAPRFFHRRPYVLFVEHKNWPDSQTPLYHLMEVNLNGSDLKDISLPN